MTTSLQKTLTRTVGRSVAIISVAAAKPRKPRPGRERGQPSPTVPAWPPIGSSVSASASTTAIIVEVVVVVVTLATAFIAVLVIVASPFFAPKKKRKEFIIFLLSLHIIYF
jgi:hypothetical protein